MKPPAFQLYADDFLAGTADMTAEEVGVYIRLLCHSWSKDGVEDNDRLSLLAGQCQASSLAHAKTKFRLIDGKLKNPRQERERDKQAEFRNRQAENAKKRWVGNAKPDAKPDAVAKPPISNLQSPCIEREKSAAAPASVEEVNTEAERYPQLPKPDANFCAWWWDEGEKRGWTDPQSGGPWRDWKAAFRAAWRGAVHNQQERASRRQQPSPELPTKPIRAKL